MRRVAFALAVSLAWFQAGCVLDGKPTQKVSAAPPAPKPASTAPAPTPPPPPPLSIRQTQAELPAPQPLSAEALATTRVSEQPVETQPAPRTPQRRPGPVAGPPKPEAVPVQAQAPAAPPPEVERPPIQEILPDAERKRLQDAAATRKREIRKVLDQAAARRLNANERALISRIQSFLQLSDEAETRGDMRQADALAERAQVLIKELQSGR